MSGNTIKLLQFESRDIFPLSTKSTGIYEQRLSVQGNGLLSTLYIETVGAGASILVEYFDRTTGIDSGESLAIASHSLLSATGSSKISVTGFHDKPIVRVTIAGGSVRFGVYATVKNLSELDANMATQDQEANLTQAKGLLIGGYDSVENKFQYLPIQDNSVRVSGGVDIEAPDGLPIYPSGLRNGGRVTEVYVNSNTWTPLPASPLANRNAITIQNNSGQPIKINYSSSTPGFVGITIQDFSERNYNITDAIPIYAKAQSGTALIVVEELS